MVKSLWFSRLKPRYDAQMRLLCFPYSGRGASFFYPWVKEFPESIDVCSIQLPGRESRLDEPLCEDFAQLVSDITEAITPNLDLPVAFFGHCLGALLAFEVTRQLRKENLPLPSVLSVSGISAPQVPVSSNPIHELPDAEFLEEMKNFNGISNEMIQNSEWRRIFIPILRADLTLSESYFYKLGQPLDIPILAYAGKFDSSVSPDEVAEWKQQTTQSFLLRVFPGDHFFLQDFRKELISTLLEDLRQFMSPIL